MSTCGPDKGPPTRTTWSAGFRKVLLCEMQATEVGEQSLKGGLSFPWGTLCSSPASTPLSTHGHTHARDQQKAPKDLLGEHVVPRTHCNLVDRDVQTTGAKRRWGTEVGPY